MLFWPVLLKKIKYEWVQFDTLLEKESLETEKDLEGILDDMTTGPDNDCKTICAIQIYVLFVKKWYSRNLPKM